MTDKVVVLVTVPNLRQAKKIAKALVESRLAACVNISSPVQSIYHWQGKLNQDREFLLIIKSARELFGEIQSAVLKLHSYATPEIICLPIVEGSADYLQWMANAVKRSVEERSP